MGASSRLTSKDRAEVRVWESENLACDTHHVSQDIPVEHCSCGTYGHDDTRSHARVGTWHREEQQEANEQGRGRLMKLVWTMMDGRSSPLDVGPEEEGEKIAERWYKMNVTNDWDIRLMAEGRIIGWNQLVDLEDGSMVQVLGNIWGGTKKKSKKKVTNPWEPDEGSGARSSSAEQQFTELDKEELMENHRRAVGNGHIDMLANMNTEHEMLMKFWENMSGVTEDQKTLAMLSLMWMVERRKEVQRVYQSEKEAEGEGTNMTKQTCDQEQGEHCGKIETTLENLVDTKREDRRQLERQGDEIMEMVRRHEKEE